MRTIETTLYLYDELPSEQAKERARDWYRMGDTEFFWAGEIQDALRAFCDTFPVEARHWEYDAYSHNVTARYTGDDNARELSGVRLRTYILNNYGRYFYERAVFRKGYMITGAVSRKSKIKKQETCCPFTGVCFDESALSPLREFIKKPDGRTFEELLGDCLDSLFADASADCAAQNEDDTVEENIRANEYEFTESGERA